MLDDGIVVFIMPAPRITTDEYLRMPETLLPQELVYGLVRDAPAPTPGHQWVAGRFFITLMAHVDHFGLGGVWMSPIDVVLDRGGHLVVQPDVIMISTPRLAIVSNRIWGAPDLVIEVLSPRPRIGTLDERLGWFAGHGVRECWLVHQAVCEVEVLEFGAGTVKSRRLCTTEERIQSTVLPGFDASPSSIFGDAWPSSLVGY
jgi:Uma2 family endonuclease